MGAGAFAAGTTAAQAGTSVARALGVYAGKTAASVGAGIGGGFAGQQVALAFGAGNTVANIFGVLGGVGAGLASGVGLQYLDKTHNWSGFYTDHLNITNPNNAKNPDADQADWKPDWEQVDGDGFTLDEAGLPIKQPTTPKPGDVFDRYGETDGTFVSPADDGASYPYGTRSMPHGENPNALHRYEVIRDFSELPDAINNLPDGQVKTDAMKAINTYWEGNPNSMTSYTGTAAQAFGQSGGAAQTQFPLPIKQLVNLGFLAEITPSPLQLPPSVFPAAGLGAMLGAEIE